MNKLTNLHEPPKPPAQLSWVTAPISIFPAPSGQLYQPQEGFKRLLSAHGCAKRLRAHGLPPRALQPNKQISLAVQKGLRAPSQHVAKILSEEPASQTPPYSNLYLNEISQGDACRCCFSRHLLEEDQSLPHRPARCCQCHEGIRTCLETSPPASTARRSPHDPRSGEGPPPRGCASRAPATSAHRGPAAGPRSPGSTALPARRAPL